MKWNKINCKEKKKYLEYLKKQVIEAEKLEEVKQKDLLDLTEEEIVLLAKSNIKPERRDRFMIFKGTTFESEYRDLVEKIAKRRNEKGTSPKL